MTSKKTYGFPIDYGDTPRNDGSRISDTVVKIVKTEKFQNICSGVLSFALAYGSQAQSAYAMPPEAGEHIAGAAAEAVNAGEAANLCPNLGNTAGTAPIGPVPAAAAAAAAVGGGVPGANTAIGTIKPPAPATNISPFMPLGRPMTPMSRTLNTIAFGSSIGWICVNAYWGNPIALAGCTIMVVTWFGTVLGVKIDAPFFSGK